MAEAHKKHLGLGIVLSISFLAVLILIFLPIFPKTPEGKSQNGLDFADRMFNELSKGSSYFIPKIKKDNEKFMGRAFEVTIKTDKPEDAEKAAGLFNTAGAHAEVQGTEIMVKGDLGALVAAVLNDTDAMYNNEGSRVSSLYGYAEKDVMKNWWQALSKMAKTLTKGKKLEEAKLIDSLNKKAIETSYNFYGISAQKVSDHAVLMTGLLLFYVAYTMWWGFAIFYIFEGIGLTMKKSKVKKEV